MSQAFPRTPGIRPVRAVSALALLALLSGCLYSFVGGGLPRHVNRVYIETFENATAYQVLSNDLLQLLQQQFPGRLGVRLSSQQNADAIVRGRLISVDEVTTNVTPGPQQGGTIQVNQRQVQIRFDAEIYDMVEDRVLWRGSGQSAVGIYREGAEQIETGRRRALEDVVAKMVQGAQSQW
jgi:hypothetical protein